MKRKPQDKRGTSKLFNKKQLQFLETKFNALSQNQRKEIQGIITENAPNAAAGFIDRDMVSQGEVVVRDGGNQNLYGGCLRFIAENGTIIFCKK